MKNTTKETINVRLNEMMPFLRPIGYVLFMMAMLIVFGFGLGYCTNMMFAP